MNHIYHYCIWYHIHHYYPQQIDTLLKDTEGVDLYKGAFSLAYGTLTLLRDAKMHLKRNRTLGCWGGIAGWEMRSDPSNEDSDLNEGVVIDPSSTVI